jgi:hypothetical protein
MERKAVVEKRFAMLLAAGVLIFAVGCNKYAGAPPAGNEKQDPKNWKNKRISPNRDKGSAQPVSSLPGK